MKILVVDEENATEALFTQRFRDEIKQGVFEFTFATSGEEALDKLSKQENPNATLILSDINMPGISGLQLLKTLKNLYPEMPIMMVTAYGDEANHMKAMAYKADGFINKPIDFAALKDKIIKYNPAKEENAVLKTVKTVTSKNKILVVDDEPALEALIRQKFRQQIRNNEMEFLFASNGMDALKLIEQEPDIGIILTDINMPEMDGLTFLSKLKEQNRLFRSIVISAYGDMENIRAAMNLGASDFITKPIDLKDLATTLEKVTEQYNFLKEGALAQNRSIEYRKELEIASYIQQTFIPHNFVPFPESKAIDVFGKMFPAKEVSGDFFDFFPVSGDKLGFVIADVSGKGVPAALFMVMSKTLLRSTALANPSPKDCIQQVSHYLCYNNESMMFVTLFYGILELKTGLITYCDAGHHPPYILSPDGTLTQLEKQGGIALGIVDDLERESSLYLEKTCQLKKGEALILFTDGVTEAINKKGEPYPIKRLEKILTANATVDFSVLVSNLKNDLTDFAEGQGQYDDITLLCIRWNGN